LSCNYSNSEALFGNSPKQYGKNNSVKNEEFTENVAEEKQSLTFITDHRGKHMMIAKDRH
jgi:hypothetical protein